VIILGIILLAVGFVTGISILWTIVLRRRRGATLEAVHGLVHAQLEAKHGASSADCSSYDNRTRSTGRSPSARLHLHRQRPHGGQGATGPSQLTSSWGWSSRPGAHPVPWGIPSTASASRRSMPWCRICAKASTTVLWRLPPRPRSGCSSRMTRAFFAPRPDTESDPCRAQRPSVHFEFQCARGVETTDRRASVELLRPHTRRVFDRRPTSGQRPLPGAESKVPTTQSA
jgi:hypothetical protein